MNGDFNLTAMLIYLTDEQAIALRSVLFNMTHPDPDVPVSTYIPDTVRLREIDDELARQGVGYIPATACNDELTLREREMQSLIPVMYQALRERSNPSNN